MASAFLDLSGLSHFLDKLRLLIVQSNWRQANSEEMDYIKNKPTIAVDGDTLVLTGWTQPTVYSVRFLLNDGTEAVYETETVESGATVSAPATAPTRTGYNFAGWFSDAAGATAFDFSAPIAANTDIYAKWTESSGEGGTITIGSYGDTTDRYNAIIGFVSPDYASYAACGSISPTAYDSSPIHVLAARYGSVTFITEAGTFLEGTLTIGTQTFNPGSPVTEAQFQYLAANIGNALEWSYTPA